MIQTGDIFYTIGYNRIGKLKVFRNVAEKVTEKTINNIQRYYTYSSPVVAGAECRKKQRELDLIKEEYKR
jgi:hypothetical protein